MHADEDLQEKVRKEVSQENWDGKDTLIILEGLDELPSHLLSQPSIFTALLSGEALSQATILVTSRPSATEQLHKHWKQRISRHFEISGFTEKMLISMHRVYCQIMNNSLASRNMSPSTHTFDQCCMYHCIVLLL